LRPPYIITRRRKTPEIMRRRVVRHCNTVRDVSFPWKVLKSFEAFVWPGYYIVSDRLRLPPTLTFILQLPHRLYTDILLPLCWKLAKSRRSHITNQFRDQIFFSPIYSRSPRIKSHITATQLRQHLIKAIKGYEFSISS
jgi:hypothetical protein